VNGTDERLLLSRSTAASALGVSVDTVARLIRDGELGAVRIGRSVLIPREDVLALVERRRGKAYQGRSGGGALGPSRGSVVH